MNIRWQKHRLEFTFKAGTSRGVLTNKDTWFLIGKDKDNFFYGECGPLKGLSPDDRPDFESKLEAVCTHINSRSVSAWDTEAFVESLVPELDLSQFPSIIMGLETLHADYLNKSERKIFDTSFYDYGTPIMINGLVWMNDPEHMYQQARQKIEAGFTCVKLKVGAIDFEKECQVLYKIREEFPEDQIMLRIDGNGAFSAKDVWQKLEKLASFEIHSIEQPIQKGQTELMRQLCKDAAMDIALDEELVGLYNKVQKEAVLE
ncbi:MAG: o-succinylbenzoate synthase, partial [Cytophagales bacterium]|nr:o-succinylbenzoate synthase [Cytophaga sp.]